MKSDQVSGMAVSFLQLQWRCKCKLSNAKDPDDTIKIMLATDNHIGFMERDPIRGQDAINTFEEILKLAVQHDVCLQPTPFVSI